MIVYSIKENKKKGGGGKPGSVFLFFAVLVFHYISELFVFCFVFYDFGPKFNIFYSLLALYHYINVPKLIGNHERCGI
eukprot:UN13259